MKHKSLRGPLVFPTGWNDWWTLQTVERVGVCVCARTVWENSNVSCTASVQLPGRPPSPPWAAEREVTEYGTMWNRATAGWQTTSSIVSQAEHELAAKFGCLRNTASEVLWRLSAEEDRQIGVGFSLCSSLLVTWVTYRSDAVKSLPVLLFWSAARGFVRTTQNLVTIHPAVFEIFQCGPR